MQRARRPFAIPPVWDLVKQEISNSLPLPVRRGHLPPSLRLTSACIPPYKHGHIPILTSHEAEAEAESEADVEK